MNPKKELLWGLWVGLQGLGLRARRASGFRVWGLGLSCNLRYRLLESLARWSERTNLVTIEISFPVYVWSQLCVLSLRLSHSSVGHRPLLVGAVNWGDGGCRTRLAEAL